VLLLGVVSIYTNSKQTYNTQEGLSRLQENARFAMGRLTREIAAAGFLGCLESSRAINNQDVVRNTLTNQGGINNFAVPVSGTNGNGANGSDIITVNRANGATGVPVDRPMLSSSSNVTLDADHPAYADIAQYDTVVIADCSRAAAFMVTNAPGNNGVLQHATGVPHPTTGQTNASTDLEWEFGSANKSLATVMVVAGNTYSIRNSARGACSAARPGYCALFENNNELVEGVQGMDIQYGIDTNGDTAVDSYEDANLVADWSEVVAIRLTLTLNEVERVQGANTGVTDLARQYTSIIRIRSRGV
jgi:type IV pilus assembly protein PilW